MDVANALIGAAETVPKLGRAGGGRCWRAGRRLTCGLSRLAGQHHVGQGQHGGAEKNTLPRNGQAQRQCGRRRKARHIPQHARFQSTKKANHGQGMMAARLRSSAGLVAMAMPTKVALIGTPFMARTPKASGCQHRQNSHNTRQAQRGLEKSVRKTALNSRHSSNRSTNSVTLSSPGLNESSQKKFGRFKSKRQATKNAAGACVSGLSKNILMRALESEWLAASTQKDRKPGSGRCSRAHGCSTARFTPFCGSAAFGRGVFCG